MEAREIVKGLKDAKEIAERKLWLAQTSGAYNRGTNSKTISKLCNQINALKVTLEIIRREFTFHLDADGN